MAIRSPYNSFVDFNTEITDCSGNSRQAKLPVYDNYGAKFQIKVEDELKPLSQKLYAGICTSDCELEVDPNYEVIQTCSRFKFMGTGSVPITEDLFPLDVGNYAPALGQPQIPEGIYDLPAFLQAISDAYQVQIDSLDFYDCCELPTISDIVVLYNGAAQVREISLQQYWGFGYVDFPAQEIEQFGFDECFRYCILNEAKETLRCSNLFYRISDPCYTTLITYHNEENGYGFRYVIYDDEGIDKITKNQIRVPFYFKNPQHQITENVVRQSNGKKVRTSTVIEKDWLGSVGYLSTDQHDRLIAALKHDVVVIDNPYSGINAQMTQEGEYTIGYPDEIKTYLAPAEFRISDERINNVNNNCGFNCGIEFVEDCDSDGGGSTPCPDKYTIEFTVGGAEMANGATLYQNNNFLNKIGAEVYREGLFQHPTGPNNVVYTAATGEFTFTPAVSVGERISIIEV